MAQKSRKKQAAFHSHSSTGFWVDHGPLGESSPVKKGAVDLRNAAHGIHMDV